MPVVTIVVFGVAIAINLAAVAISIALAVIVAVVSRALIKKPKRNPLTFENRTLTVRQPISPRQVVIGENRVGGTLVFARRAGASNADVWLVIAWTGHESQRLGNIYTDEDRNVLNSDGSVDGTLAGKLFVWHHLGSTSQTADAQMLATFPSIWTDRHQLLGCGYSVVRLVGLAANYQNSVPNLSVDVKGLKYLDYRTGLTDYSDNPAMAVAWLLQNTEFGLGEPNSFIDVSNFRFEANIHDELQNLNPIVDYLTADQATTVTTNASTDNWGLTFDIRLYTGDLIQLGIEGGGTLPTVVGTPLVDTGTYYWRRVSATVGRLYHTQQDAIDNTNVIDVTALGTGTMSIVAHGGDWKWGGVETAIIVNTTADTIRAVTPSADLRRDFSFWLGAKVRMHGTTAPGGTTEGTRYICGGRNELSGFYETEIFTTITNLEAGTQVNLTTAGSAPRVTLDGMVIKWQIVNQVLGTINGHRFSTGLGGPTVQCPTGTAVTVTGAGATLPRPLVEEQVCFWVNLESGYGQLCGLARTYSDALRGLLIAFDDVGSSGTQEYYVETEFTHSAAMRNLVTGERISSTILLETGGNQSVVDAATSYWIRTGRDTGKLATTRANALKGIADGPAPEVQSLNADTVPYPSNTNFRTGQPRFTCNGVFDADMDIEEVLRGLGSSFAGAILEPFGSGQWRIKSGVFRMPLY